MFVLFNVIVSIILSIIENLVGLTIPIDKGAIGILSIIYSLFIFLPSLGVSIRRLHDINKSGWWFLLIFIPLIGAIVLIVFDCTEGTRGNNDYGPDPKAGEAVTR